MEDKYSQVLDLSNVRCGTSSANTCTLRMYCTSKHGNGPTVLHLPDPRASTVQHGRACHFVRLISKSLLLHKITVVLHTTTVVLHITTQILYEAGAEPPAFRRRDTCKSGAAAQIPCRTCTRSTHPATSHII